MDHLSEMRLIQFLSGLNKSYDQARRQILLKGTAPTINQAYAMLIEDEIQHSTCVATMVGKPDQIAMNVNRNQGKEFHRGKRCEFYNFTGHTKENCYKLIGYPVDWKQKKQAGPFRNIHNHITSGSGSGHRYGSHGGGNFAANNISNGSCDHSYVASTSKTATNHEGNDTFFAKGQPFTEEEYKQILTLLHKDATDSKQVNMTGDTVEVTHIGKADVFGNQAVENILLVPDFKFNLLSVSKLTRELSCFVSFYPVFCIF
ncbi:uncharacterized protein LOC107873690 [Capsicum annuum]|uniref:uncharacterized protein LOC107873690 n=1 Tax=Capsicum annuum TaxID=4072 RepID=UPI001FB11B9B|nr:uncharacterized protein LOC107873690 [Capsicum annuum]